MPDLAGVLHRLPLFTELDGAEADALARLASIHSYDRGSLIFAGGEEGRTFFALISGRVKIFKLSPEGKEQILHFFGPGEMFGEVAVFTGSEYPASAEALEDCEVLAIPRARLMEQIRRRPELAFKLLGTLSRRLGRFVGMIEDLSLREVPARLSAYLLQLHPIEKGDTPMVALEITKGQLASLLGTIPETLSRILGRLSKEELIRPEGPRALRLIDIDALEDLAAGRRRL